MRQGQRGNGRGGMAEGEGKRHRGELRPMAYRERLSQRCLDCPMLHRNNTKTRGGRLIGHQATLGIEFAESRRGDVLIV